jgi:N-hydroxyarylamine O-acetyltransferase
MPDLPEEDRPDLAAYFERIGYGGATEPTLDVLHALQRLHTATIPFEAVDVFMERPVDIASAAVEAKLIGQGRGGYCYEQNGLFSRVLLALGFNVTRLVGRVSWMAPPDAPPRPRTHMALKIRLRGNDWLADVGFGGSTLTAPVLWMPDTPQTTPHATYRLRRDGGDTVLDQQLEADDGSEAEWKSVYSLSPEPQHPVDYEPANWFSSTHPTSYFRHNLICALSPADRRINLLNNRLTVRPVGGAPERRILNAEGLERCLAEDFGLPVDPDWRPHLQRAVDIGNQAG